MSIAHMGIAVFVVGVTMVSLYEQEKDLKMVPGDSYELGGFTFQFEGVQTAVCAKLHLIHGNRQCPSR